MLKPIGAICAALLMPMIAHAQESEANSAGSVGTPPRSTEVSGDVARTFFATLGVAARARDNCWKVGCLLIVNDTQGYDVVGFYVNTAAPGRDERWSRNQLLLALSPQKATFRYKTGGPGACNMPVRFVLRRRDSKDKVNLDGTASLCATPHQDAIIRVKMFEPKVIVEDGRAD